MIYWPIVLIILIILVFPITIVSVPPLLDFPIHLARSYITIQYDSNSMLREMFEIDWRPIPNLASDIVLLFLGKIFKIETAGRMLLSFCVVITVLSVIFLHRVNFGYWGWWPLLATIPAFHGALTAGFINYSIGIALIPSLLALSKMLDKHYAGYQIIANGFSAIILFFCHVISTGLFGMFLFGCSIWKILTEKKKNIKKIEMEMLILILPFIFPAAFYINHSLSEVLKRENPSIIGLWDFDSKIRGILMPFMSGEYIIDFISVLIFCSIFIFLIIRKQLSIDGSFFVGIIFVTILFFILPGRMLDAAFISDRIPIAIALVTIASTNPKKIEKKQAALFATLVLALVVGRAASMTMSWTDSSLYYARLAKAAGMIERGSSVMILSPMTELREKGFSFWHNVRMTSPNWHFSLLNAPTLHAFSVIPLTRRAVFSQLHFVWSDKQIISLTEPYRDLDFGDGGDSTWDPEIIFEKNRLKLTGESDSAVRFDYALVVYAERLLPKVRREIEKQSPIYMDKELILLRLPSPSPH